jgi:hypothetical protein
MKRYVKKIMRHKKILFLLVVLLLICLYQEFRPMIVFHTPKESGFLGKISTIEGNIDKLWIKNYKAKYRLPYKWDWKDEGEIAIFFTCYHDLFKKEYINFWRLYIFLDENGCYVSHYETEYFWLRFLK